MSTTGLSFDNRQLLKLLTKLKIRIESYDASVFLDLNPYKELKLKLKFEAISPDGFLFSVSQLKSRPDEKWRLGDLSRIEPFDPKDKFLELIQKIMAYILKHRSPQKINFDLIYYLKMRLEPEHPNGFILNTYQREHSSLV